MIRRSSPHPVAHLLGALLAGCAARDGEPTAPAGDPFTRELRSNFPAEVLRRAMLELRRATPDPAVWAPFVVFGLPG